MTTEMEKVDSALSQVAIEEKIFELAQRKANIYAKSSLVPKEYQNNIGNVLIAENMAKRMGADTLMVMQNLYVVHGKPGWSAAFLIASFNSNGRFSAIKYRFTGEQGSSDWGCQAYCTEYATGETIEGTTITWAMANAEGWVNRSGSKWKTMPEQMFRYRAATFLIRSTAPEIGMGLLTKEELEDITPEPATGDIKRGIAAVKEQLKLTTPNAEPVTAEETVDAEIVESEAVEEVAESVEPEAFTVEAEAVDADESALIDLRTAVKDKLVEKIGGMPSDQKKFLKGRVIENEDADTLNEMLADLNAM